MKTPEIFLLFLYVTALFASCGGHESWPPETSGPNLPVRYCDIQKGDKDKAVIGYVFVDTMAVNWMLPNLMKGSRLYRPDISDLRKALCSAICLSERPKGRELCFRELCPSRNG